MNSNQAFFFLSFLTECFRPREGGRLTPSWGKKIFGHFFWSKSTKNGLKRKKTKKKIQGGGPNFFLKKGNHKKSHHAKVDQRRSSHLFRPLSTAP